MRMLTALMLAVALTAGVADPALAYVGPGAGLSLFAAFWGLVVAVVGALAFVILWPLRRLLRRNRAKEAAGAPPQAADPRPHGASPRTR